MTSKICSWDVGIKNLAYCIIHKTGNKYEIKRWDIINLVKDDDKRCGGLTKKKTVCGKRAKYSGVMNNVVKYYCKTHCKQYKPQKDGWETKLMTPIDKKGEHECAYLLPKKQQECGKKAHFLDNSIDNMYYCNAHRKIVIKKIEKKNELKKFKRKKCTSKDTLILGEKMYTELDKIKELLDVDEVLIENQPSLINPVMKTIASLLFGYFIMRGNVDRKNGNKINVKWVSPCTKLKVNDDNTLELVKHVKNVKNAKNASEKYKMTKQLSIKYTKILLKNDKKWLDHLETYVKKDDLSDSFLFSYYTLYKQNKK
uniref:Holliday junction resolvase n=1 Tax=Mimivirus LCMiAC01 TaxID=2506608 RepID=A0A481YZC7_9VIRU|nr:MAG: uncharacterized protein LCMiAC01_00240 [Mimivirus LCMiAC01]